MNEELDGKKLLANQMQTGNFELLESGRKMDIAEGVGFRCGQQIWKRFEVGLVKRLENQCSQQPR